MYDRWVKDYKAYMNYLNYAPKRQAIIYTTNYIERLNREFRRVTRMKIAMPNEESVQTLMGSVAMEHNAFNSALPNITHGHGPIPYLTARAFFVEWLCR